MRSIFSHYLESLFLAIHLSLSFFSLDSPPFCIFLLQKSAFILSRPCIHFLEIVSIHRSALYTRCSGTDTGFNAPTTSLLIPQKKKKTENHKKKPTSNYFFCDHSISYGISLIFVRHHYRSYVSLFFCILFRPILSPSILVSASVQYF